MPPALVNAVAPLSFPWQTPDPFLFCVHHDDAYPAGNERMGPAVSLAGRNLGMDFEGQDGWRMYHGTVVPGFPQHPHRGFETVTVVRRGLLDHSDSMGATARYGDGDVQWLTAGRGINHSEMFPLRHGDQDNPFELFQIWLNLPRADKMVDPHFTMLWREAVPTHTTTDEAGRTTTATVVAGALGDTRPGAPPPRSWAARPASDAATWTPASSDPPDGRSAPAFAAALLRLRLPLGLLAEHLGPDGLGEGLQLLHALANAGPGGLVALDEELVEVLLHRADELGELGVARLGLGGLGLGGEGFGVVGIHGRRACRPPLTRSTFWKGLQGTQVADWSTS